MSEIRNIAFIGSGNVAWHLAPALENIGYSVKKVYSRNPDHAKNLTSRLYNAEVKHDLDFSEEHIELIIIAINDDAIESICQEMIVDESCSVIHTSGTQPMSILGYLACDSIGVFYPLQTFSKSKNVDFREVPICLETQTEELLRELKKMGDGISDTVVKMDTTDRKICHIAAVYACNFTNHLFSISEKLLERRGHDFELLLPLIRETFNKAVEVGPSNSQTGPAARADHTTIEQHLNYLQFDESLAQIYKLLSEHILNLNKPHYE